jgi:hypothetical protein
MISLVGQVQSRAAYVLFYRRRRQAQQDPPHLVNQLLEQRQLHLELKQQQQQQQQQQAEAAAAAAALAHQAAPCTNDAVLAAAMEEDVPAVPIGVSAAAPVAMSDTAADVTLLSPAGTAAADAGAAAAGVDVWGSPSPRVPVLGSSPAAARAAGMFVDEAVPMSSSQPGSPVPALPHFNTASRLAAAQRHAADTTSTSSGDSHRRLHQAGEDGDSSDGGSSSKPRGLGTGQRQQQQQQLEQELEDANKLAALQVVPAAGRSSSGGINRSSSTGVSAGGVIMRRADQSISVDADMIDRDA